VSENPSKNQRQENWEHCEFSYTSSFAPDFTGFTDATLYINQKIKVETVISCSITPAGPFWQKKKRI
jgi:hypothetical protein